MTLWKISELLLQHLPWTQPSVWPYVKIFSLGEQTWSASSANSDDLLSQAIDTYPTITQIPSDTSPVKKPGFATKEPWSTWYFLSWVLPRR